MKTTKTQEQMYYEAFAKRARVNEAFMELVDVFEYLGYSSTFEEAY